MAKVGRPVTNNSPAAKKHRDEARKAYNALPLEKRKAIVQNRDKAAQRAASRRRDEKTGGRKAYHAEVDAAHKRNPKKPHDCQWPGCTRTAGLQLNHQGKDMWLCPTHHAELRRRGYGSG